MHMRSSEFKELGCIDNTNMVDTIYIGGGTPSTLPLSDIQEILNTVSECFPGNPREVTIEVNPDDITPEFVNRLRSIGINRISMGIQTFDDSRLQFLHRRHTSSQAIDAVRIIKDAGIPAIEIDLSKSEATTAEELNKEIYNPANWNYINKEVGKQFIPRININIPNLAGLLPSTYPARHTNRRNNFGYRNYYKRRK